jgi:hypothetical protein
VVLPTFDLGGPTVDLDHAGRLLSELDIDAFTGTQEDEE